MIKFLVSDKTGDHLPYTNESGQPDHQLMGAAWAALHEGYRGNKYDGTSKDAAIAKLKTIYQAEKLTAPTEAATFDCSFMSLLEEAISDTGTIPITIIQPGFNKSGARYYPKDVLARDHKIFEGSHMFINHATDAENRSRPEGDLNNFAAVLQNVKVRENGSLGGDAVVIDPVFKAKLQMMKEAGIVNKMGVSIRAMGDVSPRLVEGRQTHYVESLSKARSVDFVTFAGAGGQVDMMESDVDPIDYTITQTRKENNMLTEVEIKKLQDDLAAANAKVASQEAENIQLKEASLKAAVVTELEKQLKEAKLPEISNEKLRTQLASETKVEAVKEAVAAEVKYVKALKGDKLKGFGEGDNGAENDKRTEAEQQEALVQAFIGMGMTEADAKVAARN